MTFRPFTRFALLVATFFALLLQGGVSLAQQNPDAEVLAQLRKAGSDLRKPHAMEFFLNFPVEAGAMRTVSKLTTLGYAAETKQVAKGGEWVVLAKRTMVPAEADLVAVRKQLSQIAAAERGQYDGWGTGLVK